MNRLTVIARVAGEVRTAGALLRDGDQPLAVAFPVAVALTDEDDLELEVLDVHGHGRGVEVVVAAAPAGQGSAPHLRPPRPGPHDPNDEIAAIFVQWESVRLERWSATWLGMTAEVWIAREGKLLVLARSDNGIFYVPGGIVDPGEQPVDGAAREAFEECGLRVSPLLDRVWNFALPGTDRPANHATYFARSISGDVVMSHEHTDHAWLEARAWFDEVFAPATTLPDGKLWPIVPQVERNVTRFEAWLRGDHVPGQPD